MPTRTAFHADDSHEIRVEDERDGIVVVRVVGTLDARVATTLEEHLGTQLNPVGGLHRLVLDLGAVESVTAPDLSALQTVQQRCHARSVRLCLLDCRRPVVDALHEAGLIDTFRRYSTLDEIELEHT